MICLFVTRLPAVCYNVFFCKIAGDQRSPLRFGAMVFNSRGHESPAVSRYVERSRQAQSKHQGAAAHNKMFASLDHSANARDDDCFYTNIVPFPGFVDAFSE